jgi:Arc/MetJ-type ribon-helix-helix transcriptional regulator
MTLTLDAATEKRIQREIDLGHYREPSEVIARAVAMLADEEEWLLRNKDAFNQRGEAQPDIVLTDEAATRAVDAAFGLWSDMEEDGLAYQERMRSEW